MPYMNNDATLADVISPAFVAQQAGMQNEQTQTEQGLHNAILQQQAPALAEEPGLKNLFQQAQTRSQNATAQGEELKNQFTQATQPGAIQATNVGSQLKISQDQAQKLGVLANLAGTVAGAMDNVPPLERPFKMQQLLQSQNIDPQSLGPLASGDPDQLRAFAKNAVQMSAQYQTEQMKETTAAGSREAVAATEAGGHVAAAGLTANARKYAADQQLKIKQLSENIDQTIAALGRKIAAAGTNADPNDMALMKTLQQQQILARQMGASTTAQLVGQGQVTQAPTFTPVAPGQGGGGGEQAPTGGGQEPTPQNFETAAKQIWPNDDPGKYQYRVGPDGSLQRKPK